MTSLDKSDISIGSRALITLDEMRKEGMLCDGEITTDDGGHFQVHRSIMATCSPYFKALFTTTLSPNEKFNVHVPGVSKNILELIVNYAYERVTAVNLENIDELAAAADQFIIDAMIHDCGKFLLDRINAENCIKALVFARKYLCEEMEKLTLSFIQKHFVVIVQSSQDLLELPLEKLLPLLNSDNLNIESEMEVWEACLQWVDYNPGERLVYVPELLATVRTGLLEQASFLQQIANHPYVVGNKHCLPIITESLKYIGMIGSIDSIDVYQPLPTPLLARPRLPQELLFVTGGWTTGSSTGILEVYDIKADNWTVPTDRDPVGPRAYHRCVTFEKCIYVLGGFDGIDYFNKCSCFNVEKRTWKDVSPMHCRRCYLSATALGRYIYAMGGHNGRIRQNTVEKYDPRTNQWTFVPSMNEKRSDACSATVGNTIYITGGFTGNECLSSVEYYRPGINWTMIAPMSVRRSGVSCIGLGNRLYVLGGFDGNSRMPSGEVYDTIQNEWYPLPDMLTPRSNFGIAVSKGLIFVVGGFDGHVTTAKAECFDVKTQNWQEISPLNYKRSAAAIGVLSDLSNVSDFVVNREQLLEEKRYKVLLGTDPDLEEGWVDMDDLNIDEDV